MNKSDLINAVSEAAGLTKGQASDAVAAVFNSIENSLKTGDKASFIGFGTFSTSERAAREGRNPATGKTINIAAKTVAKFKPGKSLAEAINK